MAIFITQGRFTPEAIKGMIASPEDRADTVAKLFAKSGGKLLSYFMTFGEYDFMVVSEGPYEAMAVTAIVVAAGGGVIDLKTTLALSSAEMKQAFTNAAPIAATFRSAGAK